MNQDDDASARLRDTAEPEPEPPPLPEPVPAASPLPTPVQPFAPPYLAYSSSVLVPYESARPRARVLVRLLWVLAVLQVAMVWPGMDDVIELRNQRASGVPAELPQNPFEELTSAAGIAFLVIGSVQLIVWIVMIVFWMMWVHRTYRNLGPLGAEGLSTSPGWAVAYNFIPIVHLYRPFLVMLEMWRASDPAHNGGTDWERLPASRLVLRYWALYVLSVIVAITAGIVVEGSDDLDTRYAAAWVGLLVVIGDIVLLVMQVRIVQRLTALQEARADALGGAPFAPATSVPATA